MLPPRRTWCCSICRSKLGHVRRSGRNSYLFATVDLQGAVKIEAGVWLLTCAAGHETLWRGAGINWWVLPKAA